MTKRLSGRGLVLLLCAIAALGLLTASALADGEPAAYPINLVNLSEGQEAFSGCTITADKTEAAAGETVTVTITIDTPDDIAIADDYPMAVYPRASGSGNDRIAMTAGENNTWTFTVPEDIADTINPDNPTISVRVQFKEITAWAKLQAAFNAGGEVMLTEDITASKKKGDMGLNIPEGVTVTLNLGGHTLNMAAELKDADNPENDAEGVIRVRGTLILEGSGTITVSNTNNPDGIYIDGGNFTMNGGTISGCDTGVYADGGSFTMNGGTISGSGFDGVYLYNANSAMNGGSITDSASYGVTVYFSHFVLNDGYITDNADGGVFMTGFNYSTEPSSFTMNGGSVTGGNYGLNMTSGVEFSMNGGSMSSDGEYVINNFTGGNISLGGGKIKGIIDLNDTSLSITGQLDADACYQVELDEPRVFTSGLSGNGSAANFASAEENLCVILNDDGEAMLADADSVARYVERSWNGTTVVSSDKIRTAVPVPSDGSMSSGWYYLNSDVTVENRVFLTGDTNLILGDGCTLDVKGLYVPPNTTLTIYGQSAGTGKIYSHPGTGAGIGGKSGSANGNIVIHGGIIEATGADHCAGIGTNDGKTGGTITIYGGTITAIGGEDGAAIGGGRYCDGGTITIYGGNITANGPTDSDCEEDIAGIGGGYEGAGGNITIYGGTITTYSRDGAGIGGGDDGDGGTITIYGGNITSTKVNNGQGARIGGGSDAAPGTIAIHGGTITTVGGKGAGIGGGKGNKSGGTVTIDGGVINASGSYGIGSGDDGADVAVTLDYTDATSETIIITASSFNGSVTLEKPFAIYSSSQLFPAGAVSDNSLLSGGALTALRSRVSTWEQLRMALEYGGSFVVTGDITASENDSDLIIPNGVTVELNLQGHSVDASALRPTEDIWTCCLSIAGSFTLSDTVGGGGFNGGDNGFTDFILMEDGSGFTMNGGTVTGSGTALEDVVYVNEDSVFIMNGGAIIADLGNGESTLGHIYVASNGSFTMNGGTVSGSGGKADVMICGGSFLLNGGSLVCSGQEYGNVYVAFHNGISSRFAAAGSPCLTAGVYLTRGRTITVAGPLGEGVIIPVMTEATPTGFSPVTITKGLAQGGENAVAHFTSALDTCAVGLDEDGEAFLGEPVTVTFAPGYGTEETMESVSWAKDGWYPLPACGFSGPAGHAFAGWRVWEDAETVNAGDLINVSDGITLTAVWQVGAFGNPDFEIPTGTRTIGDNAFEGIAATVVEIPEDCTHIGNEAFRYCTQLTMIRIPAGCQLGERVFDGCTRVYVFGAAGSPAEAYCSDPAHSNCVFVVDAQK